MTDAWTIGLMTGTVLDGMIDIAAVRTDGESVEEFGPWMLMPYPEEVRTLIADALTAAQEWGFVGPEPPIFRSAEGALTLAQAEALLDRLTSLCDH
jgi:anhydro-N-acetylmuramic acid kinase